MTQTDAPRMAVPSESLISPDNVALGVASPDSTPFTVFRSRRKELTVPSALPKIMPTSVSPVIAISPVWIRWCSQPGELLSLFTLPVLPEAEGPDLICSAVTMATMRHN